MRRSLIPIVFLARANSTQVEQPMDWIDNEWQRIENALHNAVAAGNCEVIPRHGATPVFFIQALLHPAIRSRIALLHISGETDGNRIRFDSGTGYDEVDLRTLSNALGALPNLHMVFLHGCGTRLIVEELIDAGVPAVMLTAGSSPDEQSNRVSDAFYAEFAAGNTLGTAFDAVRTVGGASYRYIELPYDSFTRSPDWTVVPGSELKPGLYVRQESVADNLDWRIRKSNPKRIQGRKRMQIGVALAALVLLFAVGGFSLASYYQLKSGRSQASRSVMGVGKTSEVTPVSGTERDTYADSVAEAAALARDTIERPALMLRDSSVFASNETYNVLILPLRAATTCDSNTPEYAKKLKQRLTELIQLHGLRTEIQLFAAEGLTPDAYSPEEIGQIRHASLVVWGNYAQPCEGEATLSLRYQPVRPQGETLFEGAGKTPDASFTQLSRTELDLVLQPILNNMLWVQANQKLEEKRYSQALHLFQLIKTEPTAAYAPVYTRQGICYLNLHNRLRAEQLLDQALELDSKYGQAYCYKGHIHRQRGLIDEAWVDYSRAIEYQPGYAEAYYSRGLVNEQVYKFQDAIRDYEEAIRIQPDFSGARERSKIVRQTNKELLDLNRQIKGNPANGDLYFEKAKLLQYQLANHDSALVYYDKGIELKNDNPHGYFERGHLFQYQFLEYEKAIADYEKGLSLKPDYRFALGNLAVIYATRQNDERFYYYIEEAMKNGYDITFFVEKAISEPYRNAPRFLELREKYP